MRSGAIETAKHLAVSFVGGMLLVPQTLVNLLARQVCTGVAGLAALVKAVPEVAWLKEPIDSDVSVVDPRRSLTMFQQSIGFGDPPPKNTDSCGWLAPYLGGEKQIQFEWVRVARLGACWPTSPTKIEGIETPTTTA